MTALAAVRLAGPGRYELTLLPGADAQDLADATAALPGVVYTDHRPVAPSGAGAVLTFRALPTEPGGVPARPSPGGGGRGWVPVLDVAAAGAVVPAYEQAVRTIVTPAAYGRYGRCLVHGLAHCDPDAVLAVAEVIRATRGHAPELRNLRRTAGDCHTHGRRPFSVSPDGGGLPVGRWSRLAARRPARRSPRAPRSTWLNSGGGPSRPESRRRPRRAAPVGDGGRVPCPV